MITCYGVKYTWGLRVHLPSGITPRHVINHKGKREVHITFIYEPIQALNVQNNPFNQVFKQEKLQILKVGLLPLRTCARSNNKKYI